MTAAALKNKAPDKNVKLPDYTPEPGSLAWRLDKLEVGDSISETKRINSDDLPLQETKSVLDSIRSVVSSSVTRLVEKRPEKKFKVEGGKWMTASDDIMCTVVVTRTE